MASSIDDATLIEALREFLKNADMTVTTPKMIRNALSEKFGVDMENKKLFIREQTDLILEEIIPSEKDENKESNSEDATPETSSSKNGGKAPAAADSGSKRKAETEPEEDEEKTEVDEESKRLIEMLAPPPRRSAAKKSTAAAPKKKPAVSKSKVEVDDGDEDDATPVAAGKARAKSGFSRPVGLKDGLKDFCGCEELTRAEVRGFGLFGVFFFFGFCIV